MKFFNDYEIRRVAEINKKNNSYAPSNIKLKKKHDSGWIVVNNLCRKSGLERNISATYMMHHVATSYVLLDVSPMPPGNEKQLHKLENF